MSELGIKSTHVRVAIPEVVKGAVVSGGEFEWDELGFRNIRDQGESPIELVSPLLNVVGFVLVCVA